MTTRESLPPRRIRRMSPARIARRATNLELAAWNLATAVLINYRSPHAPLFRDVARTGFADASRLRRL
ncbi:hypothetical protein EPO14_02135 [Patescibacteria group bacterium]|nr:MAG: hypothetical protein EPO14_02135 [Patescibacteria group bacterium]